MTDSKKDPDKNSTEFVNGFWSCRDLSDIIPLYSSRGIYLKPAAKIHVSIKLPQLKIPGIGLKDSIHVLFKKKC